MSENDRIESERMEKEILSKVLAARQLDEFSGSLLESEDDCSESVGSSEKKLMKLAKTRA